MGRGILGNPFYEMEKRSRKMRRRRRVGGVRVFIFVDPETSSRSAL